jgi:hypothetical protein
MVADDGIHKFVHELVGVEAKLLRPRHHRLRKGASGMSMPPARLRRPAMPDARVCRPRPAVEHGALAMRTDRAGRTPRGPVIPSSDCRDRRSVTWTIPARVDASGDEVLISNGPSFSLFQCQNVHGLLLVSLEIERAPTHDNIMMRIIPQMVSSVLPTA